MSSIKLSDGTILLPGDTIAMPSGPMTQDQSYYIDPLNLTAIAFTTPEPRNRKMMEARTMNTLRSNLAICLGATDAFHAQGDGMLA